MKKKRTWKKEQAKPPLKVTPLVLAVLEYGFMCQEYGKAHAYALSAIKRSESAKEAWARALTQRDRMEECIRRIAARWPGEEEGLTEVESVD